MTRRDAVARAIVMAANYGHRLGPPDRGVKWISVCRDCGAMAMAEPSSARPGHWVVSGGTRLRRCASIQKSKRRRQKIATLERLARVRGR